MAETPNKYQKQFFFASNGYYPETASELSFATTHPSSPEDAAWRHLTTSARYAMRVISALEEGDVDEAERR